MFVITVARSFLWSYLWRLRQTKYVRLHAHMCVHHLHYLHAQLCVCHPHLNFPVYSTCSLDVDDTLSLSSELSHNVATSSYTIITLLKILNLLPCKALVNKYANVLLVGQCLILVFPCFTLSSTQKNVIPVKLDLLEHEIFPFLAIFFPQNVWFHWLSLCFQEVLILNFVRQILTVP